MAGLYGTGTLGVSRAVVGAAGLYGAGTLGVGPAELAAAAASSA